MTILLTDEDIREAIAKLPPANLFIPSAYEETSVAWDEFVAKAQLKKVAEWINSDETAERMAGLLKQRGVEYYLDDALFLTGQIRKALLKEVE